jgi:inositol oxygenase
MRTCSGLATRAAERVRRFCAYDLYSKAATPVDVAALRPFYEDLAAAWLPGELSW